MKNYKLLKDRPELTNEQIIQGMDFNKIKSDAALAKSAFLKSLFIKGFFGVVLISSVVFIYKKEKPGIVEKTQMRVTDSAKIISLPEKNISANYTKVTAVDKSPASVPEYKTSLHKMIIVPSLPADTPAISYATSNEAGIKEHVNTYRNYGYEADKETVNGYPMELFTAPGQIDIKEVNKSFAKINERLYASKYEVSNKLYMTFLNSLRQSKSNASLRSVAEIDTLRWRDKFSQNEPYVHYYHAHPAYQNFPVVNITFEGAKLFCEWLTLQYNSDPKRKFKKVRFRLPSEDEWIIAAQGGNPSAIYPWEGKEIRTKRGQLMCNFKRESGDTLSIDGKKLNNGDVTTTVNSYLKNNFGLYNMSGNVAEMIDEKGITKGGSWRDGPEYLKIDTHYKYDGNAQPFVGFRYFAEIIEK